MCIPNDPDRNVLAEIRDTPAPAAPWWRCPIHGNQQMRHLDCRTCELQGIAFTPDPLAGDGHYCEGCERFTLALVPDHRGLTEWCRECIAVMPADVIESLWPVATTTATFARCGVCGECRDGIRCSEVPMVTPPD